MKIVLFTIGSAGDVLPFLRVGAALAEVGRDVSLLTHTGYAEIAEAAGLDYEAIDSREGYGAFLGDMHLLNTPRGLPEFIRKWVIERAAGVLDIFRRHCGEDTLMITPPLYDVAPRLERKLYDTRLMWLCTAPAQATALPLQTTLFSKILANDLNALRKSLGLATIADWDEWLAYSAPSLGIWPDWFGEKEPGWLAGLEPVGFVSDLSSERYALSGTITDFLGANPEPILVTGGTGEFYGTRFYEAALGAVEDLDRPCIVVTRYPKELPDTLPKRTLLIDRASFGQLLPLVGLIIHHGGIGTAAAAISAGIPQLVLPYGIDRPDNGSRVARLKLGSVLLPPKWQRSELAQEVEALLDSNAYTERCRSFSQRIASHDTSASIIRLVDSFLEDNSG